MIKSIIITTLFFITSFSSFSQENDSALKDIRAKYAEIRKNLNSYDTAMVHIMDGSTEGGRATGFYDNGQLRLIEVVWLGETGKNMIEYYLFNNKLFFAFDQNFSYNRPIYWDEQMAKANGDTEFFDPNKTIIKEDRYYFNDEKLFLWFDNDKRRVDLTSDTNTIVGKGLISHFYKVKSELGNKN